VAGTGRYGHETGRNGPDYLIAAGFGPAENIRFRGNSYLGRHIDAPQDDEGIVNPSYAGSSADWAVPLFDPAKPDGFAEFILRHQSWMLTMLGRELGTRVTPMRPSSSSFGQARR
jgi:hypothetical protein